MELKRIFNCRLLMTLLFLAGLNLLFFYLEQEKDWREYSSRYTGEQEIALRPVYQGINQRLKEWREQGLSDDEMMDTLVAISDQNRAREAQEGSTPEILTNKLMNYGLAARCREAAEYQQKMLQAVEQANTYLTIGIYNSEDSFSYQNILKTRYDYYGLSNIPIVCTQGKATEALFSWRLLSYIMLLMMLVIVGELLADKKNGLWNMLYAASGGRLHLSCRKGAVLFAAAGFVALLGIGLNLLLSLWLYGGVEFLGDSLHSSSYFQGTLFQMSMWEFLLLYFAVSVVCLFLLGLLFWLLLSVSSNQMLAVLLLMLLGVVEYLCLTFIPNESAFGMLKYLNLFSVIEPGSCLVGYTNLAFGNYAVDKRSLLLLLLPVLLLLLVPMVLLTDAKSRPCRPVSMAGKLFQKLLCGLRSITAHFSFLQMEFYKSAVLRQGCLIVLIVLAVAYMQRETVGIAYTPTQVEQNQFFAEIDPATGEGAADYIAAREAQLQKEKERLDTYENTEENFLLRESLKNNITFIQEYIAFAKACLSRKERVEAEQGVAIWLIPQADYTAVFGERSNRLQEIYAILALLAVILLNCGCVSFERTQGTEPLLRTASGGRGILFRKKAVTTIGLTLLVGFALYGMQYCSLRASYELTALSAPLQSLSAFETVPFSISIGGYLWLMYAYRILLLLAVAGMVVCISSFTSYRASMLCNLLLLMPYVLSKVGIAFFNAIALVVPIAYIPQYLEYGWGIRSFAGGITVLLLGGAAWGVAAWKNR